MANLTDEVATLRVSNSKYADEQRAAKAPRLSAPSEESQDWIGNYNSLHAQYGTLQEECRVMGHVAKTDA